MAVADPSTADLTPPRRASAEARLLVPGGLLVAAMAAMIPLSWATPGPELAVATMALLLAASALWLRLIGQLQGADFLVLLVIGAAMRLVLLPSDPILERDFYRYLWDGAAVSAGLNPYLTPPEAVLSGQAGPAWQALAEGSNGVAQSITYPHLSTIYPTVAQLGFVLAHWLDPWGLTGLRLVLLGAEVAGVLLLIRLLDTLNRPRAWVAIYWCNPLISKELTNSAHMEALLIPCLIGATLLAVQGRKTAASLALATAAAVKLWPLVLAPVLFAGTTWRRWALACITLGAATLALLLPVLLSRLDQSSGFVAYAGNWERNAALFPLLAWATESALNAIGAHLIDAGRIARAIVALIVAGTALLLARPGPERIVTGALTVTALLLLLSPTGYPWYYAWLLPFLALAPSRGLLLLGALLPLYYLRFAMVDWELAHVFDTWIVWAIFLPPLALLAWDARHAK